MPWSGLSCRGGAGSAGLLVIDLDVDGARIDALARRGREGDGAADGEIDAAGTAVGEGDRGRAGEGHQQGRAGGGVGEVGRGFDDRHGGVVGTAQIVGRDAGGARTDQLRRAAAAIANVGGANRNIAVGGQAVEDDGPEIHRAGGGEGQRLDHLGADLERHGDADRGRRDRGRGDHCDKGRGQLAHWSPFAGSDRN